MKRAANFERRQEWSAALSPESFLGGAASVRWCVAFLLRWRSRLSPQAFRRNLEVCNNIADNLSRVVGVEAASQRLILAGERSGLQTHTATMESVSLCTRL